MSLSKSAAATKVSRARHIVTLWSPWWTTYLGQCEYIYVYDDSVSITGSSSLVMTIGMEFVESHGLMDIAIHIEFALQQMLRSMDSRAETYIDIYPGVRSDIVGLSQALEINSDINAKFSSVSQADWEELVARSVDKEYLSSFDVKTKPHLPNGFFLPEMFGFPDGLTAEKYATLLTELNNAQEEEFLNRDEEPQQGDDGRGDNQSGDNNGEDSRGNEKDGDTEETQSANQGESDAHSDSHSGGDGTSSGSGNPTEQGASSGAGAPSGSTKNTSAVGAGAPSDSPLKPGSSHSSGDSPPSSDNSSSSVHHDSLQSGVDSRESQSENGGSQGGSFPSPTEESGGELADIEKNIMDDYEALHDDSMERTSDTRTDERGADDVVQSEKVDNPWKDNAPSGDTAPNPQDGSLIDSKGDASAIEAGIAASQDTSAYADALDTSQMENDYQHLMDRLQRSTTSEGAYNLDAPRFPSHPIAPGVSAEERKDIDKELAAAVQEYTDALPAQGGFATRTSISEWSNEKLRKSVVPWQKVLRKMTTISVSRAQMSGTADLSYAKQNPNQQPDMPIMMGFVTYPPEVTVLVDASPSMVNNKKKTISEFVGLVQKILLQYSQPVVMAAADSNIQYVSYSTSPAHNIIKNIGKTFDGSSATFGKTVQKVARKGVSFRGRHYPEPDILIIFTDCLFHWPLQSNSKLPLSYATVIVASTQPYDKVKEYLPRWVKEKKNFVYIPE